MTNPIPIARPRRALDIRPRARRYRFGVSGHGWFWTGYFAVVLLVVWMW